FFILDNNFFDDMFKLFTGPSSSDELIEMNVIKMVDNISSISEYLPELNYIDKMGYRELVNDIYKDSSNFTIDNLTNALIVTKNTANYVFVLARMSFYLFILGFLLKTIAIDFIIPHAIDISYATLNKIILPYLKKNTKITGEFYVDVFVIIVVVLYGSLLVAERIKPNEKVEEIEETEETDGYRKRKRRSTRRTANGKKINKK
ncbi:MAG: hypothetical protein EBT98_12475, partial [Opitutaceae bacterium]|nr:hypothetical protein [Opitutaceae bacterium]